MAADRKRSKAGFVYVLSSEEMPGVVKIGMTQRDPEVRLREINSATGVLPFVLEAVIVSRNARWTEREVHARLAGRRVRDDREFFRIEAGEARRVVFNVARSQRQKAYGKRQGTWPRARAAILFLSVLPVAWAVDPQLAVIWVAGSFCALLAKRPRFLHEFLAMNLGWFATSTVAAAGFVASMLLRPEWLNEAAALAAAGILML